MDKSKDYKKLYEELLVRYANSRAENFALEERLDKEERLSIERENKLRDCFNEELLEKKKWMNHLYSKRFQLMQKALDIEKPSVDYSSIRLFFKIEGYDISNGCIWKLGTEDEEDGEVYTLYGVYRTFCYRNKLQALSVYRFEEWLKDNGVDEYDFSGWDEEDEKTPNEHSPEAAIEAF